MTRGLADHGGDREAFQEELDETRGILRDQLVAEFKRVVNSKKRKKPAVPAVAAEPAPTPAQPARPARPPAVPPTIATAPALLQQVMFPKPDVRKALEAAGVSMEKLKDRDAREMEMKMDVAKEYLAAGWEAGRVAQEEDNQKPTGRGVQSVYGTSVPRNEAVRNAKYAANASWQEGGGRAKHTKTEKMKTTTPKVKAALEKIGTTKDLIKSAEAVLKARWPAAELKDLSTKCSEHRLYTGFWSGLARANRVSFTDCESTDAGDECKWVPVAGRILKVLLEDATGLTFLTRDRGSWNARVLQSGPVTMPDGSEYIMSGKLANLSVRSPTSASSTSTSTAAVAIASSFSSSSSVAAAINRRRNHCLTRARSAAG